jgi:4-cresol dehydrogenase (hydroxylating)
VAAEHGWGEYRTHIGFMEDVVEAYSYNNYALLRLHETVKDALDPNGILSPGKSGIWPQRMRKPRA